MPFNRELKHDWGKGILSSEQLQRYAQTASQQGARGVERLAGVGAGGQQAGNLYRDLVNLFGWPGGCAPLEWVTIPTKAGLLTPHPVLFPHRFFQMLYAHRHDEFQRRLVGPDGGCSEFWNGIRESEVVKNHPFLPSEIWPATIPLGFHGDGGSFNKHDSLFCFSWNSLVTSGRTMQTRFMFTGVRKSEMPKLL